MVALAYETLGGISSVATNPEASAGARSRDRNDKQRISFNADPANPFTGIVHIQATVNDPSSSDANTTWFDIAEVPTKQADDAINILEFSWLTRYLWPTEIVIDRGKEFAAKVQHTIHNEYGIKKINHYSKSTSQCHG